MDDWITAANLTRYRAMLSGAADDAERQLIQKLIAEEAHKHNTSRRGGKSGAPDEREGD